MTVPHARAIVAVFMGHDGRCHWSAGRQSSKCSRPLLSPSILLATALHISVKGRPAASTSWVFTETRLLQRLARGLESRPPLSGQCLVHLFASNLCWVGMQMYIDESVRYETILAFKPVLPLEAHRIKMPLSGKRRDKDPIWDSSFEKSRFQTKTSDLVHIWLVKTCIYTV